MKISKLKKERRKNREPIVNKLIKCPNCKRMTPHGHFVPPFLGEKGYFVCNMF